MYKPLYCIGIVLCLVPPYNANNSLVAKVHKCYAIAFIVILFFGNILSLYGRSLLVYPDLTLISSVIDVLSQTATTSLVMVTIQKSTIKFAQKVTTIESVLKELKFRTGIQKVKRCSFLGQMIIVHIFYACLTIYGSIISTVEINLPYIIQYYCDYYSGMVVILTHSYAFSVRQALQALNQFFTNNVENQPQEITIFNSQFTRLIGAEKSIHRTTKHFKSKLETISQTKKSYHKIIELYDSLNLVLGWPMLLLAVTVFLTLLEFTNRTLELVIDKDGYFTGGGWMKLRGYVYDIAYSGAKVTMGIVVAVVCDWTTREAQRTAGLCYTLLLDIPAANHNVQDRILREELILLSQQTTHQCPYFSAAGFFRVDYTLLFGLLGTVTSYIVVLIQINK